MMIPKLKVRKKKMYSCEDNFLPNSHHTEVINKISDANFPWYRKASSPHFTHTFYEDFKPVSAHISAFQYVIERLLEHFSILFFTDTRTLRSFKKRNVFFKESYFFYLSFT